LSPDATSITAQATARRAARLRKTEIPANPAIVPIPIQTAAGSGTALTEALTPPT
jgi:hypothetical protein